MHTRTNNFAVSCSFSRCLLRELFVLLSFYTRCDNRRRSFQMIPHISVINIQKVAHKNTLNRITCLRIFRIEQPYRYSYFGLCFFLKKDSISKTASCLGANCLFIQTDRRTVYVTTHYSENHTLIPAQMRIDRLQLSFHNNFFDSTYTHKLNRLFITLCKLIECNNISYTIHLRIKCIIRSLSLDI